MSWDRYKEELRRMWKEVVLVYYKVIHKIFLKRLGKITKILRTAVLSSGLGFEPGVSRGRTLKMSACQFLRTYKVSRKLCGYSYDLSQHDPPITVFQKYLEYKCCVSAKVF